MKNLLDYTQISLKDAIKGGLITSGLLAANEIYQGGRETTVGDIADTLFVDSDIIGKSMIASAAASVVTNVAIDAVVDLVGSARSKKLVNEANEEEE